MGKELLKEPTIGLPQGWTEGNAIVQLDGAVPQIVLPKADDPETAKDLVLRVAAGKTARIKGDPSILCEEQKAGYRLILDGREGGLSTDAENPVIGADEEGHPVYDGEPKVALQLRGIDEVVIRGKSTARDRDGLPAVEKIGVPMSKEIRVSGDSLRRMLDRGTVTIIRRGLKAPEDR